MTNNKKKGESFMPSGSIGILKVALINAFGILLADVAMAQQLVLTQSTFIGDQRAVLTDSVRAVAVDDEGNVYVGGTTRFLASDPDENGIPTTPSSVALTSVDDPEDPCSFFCSYVVKLGPNLEVFYGAILPELELEDIAVDAAGAAYAVGSIRPTIADGHEATPGAFSSEGELFALKINPDGSAFDYLGRFPGRAATAIDVADDGTAYIAGDIAASTLPTTDGVIRPEITYASHLFEPDGFLWKIDPTGSEVLFATYLGGTELEAIHDVAVDPDGGAVVAGRSASSDFTGFPVANNGGEDAFVIRIAPDGTAVTAGRFLGGSAAERASTVAVESDGGYVIAGVTESADFPVTGGVIQSRLLGEANGWVARLGQDMSVSYSTYLGGSFFDGFEGVAVDADGRAYVAGATFSADMLTTPDAAQPISSNAISDRLAGAGTDFYPKSHSAGLEAYFAVLSTDGTELEYATFLGGVYTSPRLNPPRSWVRSLTRTADGKVYLGGETSTEDFPVTGNGLRAELGGRQDGFLARFEPQSLSVTTQARLPDADIEDDYSVWLAAEGGVPPYSWTLGGFKPPDGIVLSADGQVSGQAANDQSEFWAYQFVVRVTDSMGAVASKAMMLRPIYPGGTRCTENLCQLTMNLNAQFNLEPPYLARATPPVFWDVIGEMPPELELDPVHNTYNGKLATPGEYRFAFSLVDSSDVSAVLNWELSIVDPDAPAPDPPEPPSQEQPAASGGGGGGAFGLGGLVALLLFGARRYHARDNAYRSTSRNGTWSRVYATPLSSFRAQDSRRGRWQSGPARVPVRALHDR